MKEQAGWLGATRRRRPRAAALALTLAASLGVAGWGAGVPENVLLVVNADSWASTRIANEYVSLRQIPAGNVVFLSDLPSFEDLDVNAFRERVLKPVLDAIADRGLDEQISYIIYSSDLPATIHVAPDFADRKLPQVLTPDAAINGLTFLAPLVMTKNPQYLDLNVNHYARRPIAVRRDTEWAPAEMEQYQTATKLMQNPTQRAPEDKEADEAKVRVRNLGEAVRLLVAVAGKHPHADHVQYNLACGLALAGRNDEAMAALDRAFAAGWFDVEHTQTDSDLKGLRERADFQELCGKMAAVKLDLQPTTGFRTHRGWTPAGEQVATDQGARYYLSTVLAWTSGRGNSVGEALAYLRRSAAADGTRPQGTVYLEKNGDVRSTTRHWAFRSTAQLLQEAKVTTVIEDGILPRQKADVAGAVIGAADFRWAESQSTILPGAICEHLTSLGGILQEGCGQAPLTEFLRHGAAGASGTVTEPYAIQAKFPFAFLHVHYARGCTLAEAFYQSVTGPYQLLIVGDPLCRLWGRKLVVAVKGLKPQVTLKGTARLTPTVTSPDGLRAAECAWFVDGWRVRGTKPDEALALDTTQFPDGAHELTVVAWADDAVLTPGRLTIPFTIRNSRRELKVSAPPVPQVPWNTPFMLSAELSGAKEIVFQHQGRVVATIVGARGQARMDPRLLGEGPVRLDPVGTIVTGKTTTVVRGPPLTFTVVPPPPLPGQTLPKDARQAPGLLLRVAGKPPVVLPHLHGDWFSRARLTPGTQFTIESWFDVPTDDTYQFQVRTNVNVQALSVDDVRQDWPRGKVWWFVPVALGKGLHRLQIAGGSVEQPAFELRFGGAGAFRADGARFQHVVAPDEVPLP